MATRAELVAAARDLNKVLDLEPAIDVKQGVSDLRAKILEAQQLMRDGDPIAESTQAIIDELKAPPEGESSSDAEVDTDAGVEPEDSGETVTASKSKSSKSKSTAKEPKGPKTAKPKAESNGAVRSRYPDTAIITVLSTENPKQKGSAAHGRFELYRSGMTVAEFLSAGGTRADLSWDSHAKRNFISIAA